jgi:hypothetical protein
MDRLCWVNKSPLPQPQLHWLQGHCQQPLTSLRKQTRGAGVSDQGSSKGFSPLRPEHTFAGNGPALCALLERK